MQGVKYQACLCKRVQWTEHAVAVKKTHRMVHIAERSRDQARTRGKEKSDGV